MTNQWESRERRIKKMAIVLSVLLHFIAVVMISSSFGGNSLPDFFKSLFGAEQMEQVEDVKV